VVDKRLVGKCIAYRVKWKGCPLSESSWKDIQYLLDNNVNVVIEFEKAQDLMQAQDNAMEEKSGPQVLLSARARGDGPNPPGGDQPQRDCPLCREARTLLGFLNMVCLAESPWMIKVMTLEDRDFQKAKYRLFVDTPENLAECFENGKNAQLRIICYYSFTMKFMVTIEGQNGNEKCCRYAGLEQSAKSGLAL